MPSTGPVNGDVSFWWSSIGRPEPRPALPGPLDVDVCIVGAGYTGLWTAYYLKKAAPGLRIAVLEQRFAGFGASGRNGGWLTNEITGGVSSYARTHGRDAVDEFQLAVNGTVDEVIAVAAAEGIDADIVKGGEYQVARGPAQKRRLEAAVAAAQARAHTDVELLGAAEASARIAVSGTSAGMWHPHCARIHPAKLAAGLARTVEALGVVIHEDTRVDEIRPGAAVTARGTVRAGVVLRATEGFTAQLSGHRREWLPMNSSLIATEPLPAAVWDELGWAGRETLGDLAHAYMYAQRTADDRIAIGGRGVPYRYGSGLDIDGATDPRTLGRLREVLERFFPVLRGVRIEHVWSGVLGVPRDWHATVGLDRATGLGWAGGFVGTGVTATNLAGRTLRDLVLHHLGAGERTPLTGLPWVDHRVRKWEPEPLRWLAVTTLYTAYGLADAAEARGRVTTSPLATLADVVAGRSH
ncbi:FAD-binding oxidoreductase [Rathayibacter sp. SD072]|uniref:NAD(P)/FAD-dependent oxidoreductase n=1 Tax=Rathayibacter sp. SD072 TaxID=2781731 RepID=UPI001A95D6DF|nr:FAD-dependent oxidoreductase [Rathayibacter sp. SD072]MBO0982951.1 FAD-dependent oxidoreductase [Rathayibacter sp. SD072]